MLCLVSFFGGAEVRVCRVPHPAKVLRSESRSAYKWNVFRLASTVSFALYNGTHAAIHSRSHGHCTSVQKTELITAQSIHARSDLQVSSRLLRRSMQRREKRASWLAFATAFDCVARDWLPWAHRSSTWSRRRRQTRCQHHLLKILCPVSCVTWLATKHVSASLLTTTGETRVSFLCPLRPKRRPSSESSSRLPSRWSDRLLVQAQIGRAGIGHGPSSAEYARLDRSVHHTTLCVSLQSHDRPPACARNHQHPLFKWSAKHEWTQESACRRKFTAADLRTTDYATYGFNSSHRKWIRARSRWGNADVQKLLNPLGPRF